jgi:hypothetical protein
MTNVEKLVMLEKYLDDLEHRIIPEVEIKIRTEWENFWHGKYDGYVFSPRRPPGTPPRITWPKISINEAFADREKMVLHQLRYCSDILQSGSGDLLAVRANYGTGILPTLFGAKLFMMDEKLNTLPTTLPLGGGIETLQRLIEAGIPDLQSGLGKLTLETTKYYKQLFAPYPNISHHIAVYHPDLQGPLDVCELLAGSNLFLYLIDFPDIIKQLLKLITETYIFFMQEWNKIIKPQPYTVHWGMLMKGNVMLRDDSAVNLSPQMVEEFVLPYDQIIMDKFGGGAIHFCGKGDHFIEVISKIRGLYAINMGQPELNNMEIILQHTIQKGIKIIGLSQTVARSLQYKKHYPKSFIHSR